MAQVEFFLGLACILCLPSFTDSFQNGASPSACTSLSPASGHGQSTQTSISPFAIEVSSSTYTPGGADVTVRLVSRCAGISFRGFLLTARRADTSKDGSAQIGTFDQPSGTQDRCTGSRTHTSNSDKEQVVFQWTPPSADEGPIVFRATFVETRPVFWEDVHSDVLQVQGGTPVAPDNLVSSSLTTQAPGANCEVSTGSVTKDVACGTTKGCFSSCSGSTCSFLLSWVPDATGNNVIITLTAAVRPGNYYVAFGLSSDNSMGDDSVTECTNVGGNVRGYLSKNSRRDNDRLADQSDLISTTGSYDDGVLTCTFTRAKTGSTNDVFNLDATKYTIFLAIGAASAAEILQHSDIPVISAEAVSMEDVTVDVGSTALNFPLIKVHGSLMMVAWIFAASIGIVMARYFKTVWSDSTWFGQKIWFQIHRTCMVIVLFATVVAFIIIFVEVGGYSEITGETYKKAHPILGIIVTALCVINPIMALFRPHPNTPNRPIFNWAHWAVGTAAHIMGVVTIFFGVRLEKLAAPDYIIYVLVAFVAWQFLIHLLLELTQCVGRNSDRSDMYEMSSPGSHTKPASSGEQSTFAKQLLLGTHMLVVTGFIIALLVILNIEDDHDH